jgi:hypothetical protein
MRCMRQRGALVGVALHTLHRQRRRQREGQRQRQRQRERQARLRAARESPYPHQAPN